MTAYVLDTSVVIKWFSEYDEDDLDKALGLRQTIAEGTDTAIVPDLLFYELANALRHNPKFTAHDVRDAVGSVIDMGLEMQGITEAVLERAVEIAFTFKVTVYDSYFLAISQMEGHPLVTADYRFAERIKGFKGIVRLSDI